MRIKTSITLSQELLRAMDRVLQGGQSRSDLIEKAVTSYIAETTRRERDARELGILNKESRRLNAEAADVLSYQVIP